MRPAKPPFETLVFCTSYVAGPVEWAARYRRWLEHHQSQPWGAALWCLMDDASPWQPPADEVQLVSVSAALPAAPGLPLMVRFEDHLGLQPGRCFPGWWRSFVHSVAVARHYGCTRIIHIESDAYVLTRRMQGFLMSRTAGWTAMWCPRWNFPESAIQVICEDQFDAMQRLAEGGWDRFAGAFAERLLPFTDVVREPHGNRYSEFRTRIPGYADFAAQVTPAQQVWFR
jgi:hypothetical protein